MSNTENPTAASKSPSHIVYHVRDRNGQKAIFTRIGAAWPHKDGKGFSIEFETLPLEKRLALRVNTRAKA